MEQLQRLAETIADIYVRDLKRETGSDVITLNEVSKKVCPELLASGLVDNIVYFAKEEHGDAYDTHAYSDMSMMISIDGREYRLTPFGRNLINVLTTNALKKQSKITAH